MGYIGLYELTKIIKGVSHTQPEGHSFAIKVIKHLKQATDKWKKETGIGFNLYGTESKNICNFFAKVDKEKFGSIDDITDKGYYTSAYHIDYRENMNIFDMLSLENEFQKISSGGFISYVKLDNLKDNSITLEDLIRFAYDNVQYMGLI